MGISLFLGDMLVHFYSSEIRQCPETDMKVSQDRKYF